MKPHYQATDTTERQTLSNGKVIRNFKLLAMIFQDVMSLNSHNSSFNNLG